MDHLAGMLALVPVDRFGRLDIAQPRQPAPLENPADGGRRDADLMGDAAATTRSSTTQQWPVAYREERSAMPARPSALARSTQRATILAATR